MKTVLVVVALFVAIEVETHQTRENHYYGPGVGNGRWNNPGRGPPWLYPSQQQDRQSNVFGPEVEWICHSPKSDDMMVIAADNTKQNPGRGPWWQNLLPGQQRQWQWDRPIIIVQDPTRITVGNGDPNQSPSPPLLTTPKINNNDNTNQPRTTPNYGGEGLIDIRSGMK